MLTLWAKKPDTILASIDEAIRKDNDFPTTRNILYVLIAATMTNDMYCYSSDKEIIIKQINELAGIHTSYTDVNIIIGTAMIQCRVVIRVSSSSISGLIELIKCSIIQEIEHRELLTLLHRIMPHDTHITSVTTPDRILVNHETIKGLCFRHTMENLMQIIITAHKVETL